MIQSNFNIYNGENYSLLKTRNYGEIVFGCPPDIVKEFIKLKKPLPSKYIFPSNTFKNISNSFDFEFIIYSYLFTRAKGNTVSAYCRPEQEKRFRAILNETLFGPRFEQILEAQNHKIINNEAFANIERKQFKLFQHKHIAKNHALSELFNKLLKNQASDLIITRTIKQFFEDKILLKESWLKKHNIKNLSIKLTKNYLLCAQLQKEMQLFSLAKESSRKSFLSKIIKFHHINSSGLFILKNKKDKHEFLKIKEEDHGVFVVYEKDQKCCTININTKIRNRNYKNIKAFQIPKFGITFLGVGSGFSHNKQNSSVVIWSEGKGILMDVVAKHSTIVKKYGINNDDLNHIFLTHVHSDHDAGILEKVLNTKKINLISTQVIYESFLRKAVSTTSLSKVSFKNLIKFKEVEPYKKIKIPGFKNTFFEFDYSLHSIPSGRCKITYAKGSFKKSISHSGDTKYDIHKINDWYENGTLTKNRKKSLMGFIWDSDLIVHDVGGGILHTNHKSLLHLENDIIKKLVLVHQNENPPPKNPFRYAMDGETITLIK